MAIMKAKCTNCNGNLEVDTEKKVLYCPFCGTQFVVEQAINNYNINNNITAGNVQLYAGKSSMEELVNKETAYYLAKDFKRLHTLYDEMIDLYPTRYEGWWGKVKESTNYFKVSNRTQFNNEDKYFSMCMIYAPHEINPQLQKIYNDYKKECVLRKEKEEAYALFLSKQKNMEHQARIEAFRKKDRRKRIIALLITVLSFLIAICMLCAGLKTGFAIFLLISFASGILAI